MNCTPTYVSFFFLIAAWTFTTSAQSVHPKMTRSSPEATIRSLYREVIIHAPSGLLEGADIKRFAPYLSKALRHKMDLAAACESDWFRQNGGQVVKAPFAWSEGGLFSGGNERASPGNFHIQSIQKTDGRSFRIIVGMTYRPVDGSGAWRVTDTVIREDGRFVVDEVLYPKDETRDHDWTLSKKLSEGCDGPHWVRIRSG